MTFKTLWIGKFVQLKNRNSIGRLLNKDVEVEPTTGIEPVNLFLTKEALYLLSYVGSKCTLAAHANFVNPLHLLPA